GVDPGIGCPDEDVTGEKVLRLGRLALTHFHLALEDEDIGVAQGSRGHAEAGAEVYHFHFLRINRETVGRFRHVGNDGSLDETALHRGLDHQHAGGLEGDGGTALEAYRGHAFHER